MIESKAWVDKYRPSNINEIFLPSSTRKQLSKYIEDDNIPSLLLSGQSGIGKTTAALALCNQLDLEYMLINASLVGIDAVRTDIINFCSSIALNGKRKVIILDEADGLTAAAQSALRGVINEFTDNVSFIITANFKNKLIEPLISRLTNVEFDFPKNEIPDLARGIFKFLKERMEEFGIEYDEKAIQNFIVINLKKSSDIRKIILGAQKISLNGKFDNDSLIDIDHQNLSEIIPLLKNKKFNEIRKWVGENNISNATITSYIFDNIDKLVGNELAFASIVIIINEHQYKDSFVVDKEINNTCMLLEISQVI